MICGWLSALVPYRLLVGERAMGGLRHRTSQIATSLESLECRAMLSGNSPIVAYDSYDALEDQRLVVDASNGVLSNDSDPESDPLTVVIESFPIWGSLSLNEDGSFQYTPSRNHFGIDSFTYRATDGTSYSPLSHVNITIADVHDLPVANADTYYVWEDFQLEHTSMNGVLVNDVLGDGSSLTPTLVSTTSHGTLNFLSDGTFDYVPDPDFNGEDSFTYQVNDGTGDSLLPATVTIHVQPRPEAPIIASSAGTQHVVGRRPTLVDATAILTDADSVNFEGGFMTAGVVSGPGINDFLGFSSRGANRGAVNVKRGMLRVGKLVIGTVSGGQNQRQLDITFNSNATIERVQMVVRALTFSNRSKVSGVREIGYIVIDDQGQQSNGVSSFIDASNRKAAR